MSEQIIYLASPYTHEDTSVKRRRFELASKAAAALMRFGHVVFSPIAMTHPMALYGDMTGAWAFWERFDTAFVNVCDELWVLQLDGWDRSVGVTAEIELARKMGKTIVYLDPTHIGVERS